jgi:biopolymer transport protein TolR
VHKSIVRRDGDRQGNNFRQTRVQSTMKAELNLTPMIDVLLVLIIIFMVIAPSLSVGLDTKVPQPSQDQDRTTPPQDIVIIVLGNGKLRLNQLQIDFVDLGSELREFLKKGAPGAAFVRGESDVDFGKVATVIEVARAAGWEKVALMPE